MLLDPVPRVPCEGGPASVRACSVLAAAEDGGALMLVRLGPTGTRFYEVHDADGTVVGEVWMLMLPHPARLWRACRWPRGGEPEHAESPFGTRGAAVAWVLAGGR